MFLTADHKRPELMQNWAAPLAENIRYDLAQLI
jgi:hypothetical protein